MADDKKRSALDALTVASGFMPAPLPTPAPMIEPPAERAPEPPPSRARAPGDRHRTSITMPKIIWRRLREIGLNTDRDANSLMLEAIDLLLEKNGYHERTGAC